MHDLQELSLHNKGEDGSDKKEFHIIGKIHQFQSNQSLSRPFSNKPGIALFIREV